MPADTLSPARSSSSVWLLFGRHVYFRFGIAPRLKTVTNLSRFPEYQKIARVWPVRLARTEPKRARPPTLQVGDDLSRVAGAAIRWPVPLAEWERGANRLLQVPEHRPRRDSHSRSDFCDGQTFLAERPRAFGTHLEGAELPPLDAASTYLALAAGPSPAHSTDG